MRIEINGGGPKIQQMIDSTMKDVSVWKKKLENHNFKPNSTYGPGGASFRPIVSTKKRMSFYDLT